MLKYKAIVNRPFVEMLWKKWREVTYILIVYNLFQSLHEVSSTAAISFKPE